VCNILLLFVQWTGNFAGREIPDWPRLLHLYSRLKPGKTVFEWMEAFEVHKLGVDVRRFTSFGVIKVINTLLSFSNRRAECNTVIQGFLRRVHRWPVLLPEHRSHAPPPEQPLVGNKGRSQSGLEAPQLLVETTAASELAQKLPTTESTESSRKASVAETILEQVRKKDLTTMGIVPGCENPQDKADSQSRRHSLISPIPPSSSVAILSTYNNQPGPKSSAATIHHPPRIRPTRSPSHPNLIQTLPAPTLAYPPELLPLLDGEHHTDELATRFEAGWPLLEQWLVAAGGGNGDGDFGRVSIIYR
jgi:hypothetical protein